MIQTLYGHTSGVYGLTVLPNGNLVSGSADNTIKIWNPSNGSIVQNISNDSIDNRALTVLQNGNSVSSSFIICSCF